MYLPHEPQDSAELLDILSQIVDCTPLPWFFRRPRNRFLNAFPRQPLHRVFSGFTLFKLIGHEKNDRLTITL